MKLYLSGPMTGYPNHNAEAFAEAARAVAALGHEPVNPAELDHQASVETAGDGWNIDDTTYDELVKRDLEHLADVDGVVFLPGWEKSGGAGREGLRALTLGKALYRWHPAFPRELDELDPAYFIEFHTTERLRPQTQEA